jgi:hypothetical protein
MRPEEEGVVHFFHKNTNTEQEMTGHWRSGKAEKYSGTAPFQSRPR